MRTGPTARSSSTSTSHESDVNSNVSTQAQVGGRSAHTDARFSALNRAPRVQEAIDDEGYKKTMTGLNSLIADAKEAKDSKLADRALVGSFAMNHLYMEGLDPKLGGSLASYLRGATRRPKDVDIEMPSAGELDTAFELLNGRFRYKGESLEVTSDRGNFRKGVGALLDVELNLSDTRSSSARVGIDLVNENASAFNQELVAPERTGSPTVGTTDTLRLVVNAIDRRLNDPRRSATKGDASAVYRLLKNKGYHPSDPSHWDAIREEIASKLQNPDDVTTYMDELRAMLTEYADKRSDRRGKGKSKSKSDCTLL